MTGFRPLRISLVAATAATILGAAVTPSLATPSAPTAPAAPPASDAVASVAPERLIVGYKAESGASRSNAEAEKNAKATAKKAGLSADFGRRLGTGAALIDLGVALGKNDLDAVIAAFKANPDVAYVVPDARMYATAAAPNDSLYSRQWDLFESAAGMNVPGAWDKATGKGIKVAVIDTGYVAHSDLAANIVDGYDFISSTKTANDGDGRDGDAADPGDWLTRGECGTDRFGNPVPAGDTDSSWHGTHVAGTIAAATNNDKGIAGVAYDAKIQPVRVLGKCGGSTADIIDAITWASGGTVQGVPNNPTPAHVINMSLGGDGACDQGTQSAINSAVGRGTTVVVAAGNSNANAGNYTPSSCDNVISVAAGDREGNRARYSNYGDAVDITAPGGETNVRPADGILSTVDTGTRAPAGETYKAYQGTSMAAPHIAGLAALLYEAKPGITPGDVETAVKNNARALPGSCGGGCGAGLADAAATLGKGGGTDPTPTPTPGTNVFTNTDDVAIPDAGIYWTTSTIQVSGRQGSGPDNLKLAVDIKHPYRGDLTLELVAPDGAAWPLKDATYEEPGKDLITTYALDASTVPANGTWTLRVADAYSGYTGHLDSWSLTF
ncbi:S8 family serine peptidase [Streptomyces sp. NPDC058486]|uniref:S8 family serine peptidase n=1 Tax=unclassified Streptomyces TaxID=2593676 RepID=UPI00366A28E9